MSNARRGLPTVKTIGSLLENRRTRTCGDAYLELASITNERAMLRRELDRWLRRQSEIETRLAELAKKEDLLLAVTRRESPGQALTAGEPKPQLPSAKARIKSRDLSY